MNLLLLRHKGVFTLGWVAILAATISLARFTAPATAPARPSGQVVAAPREPAPVPVVPTSLVRKLAAVPAVKAPLLLAYHQVDEDSREPLAIRPGALAAQLELLARAGYRTIGPADLVRWARGGTVPPRSVHLSFDGRAGVRRYVDALLAARGFRASVFVSADRQGRAADYLTWADVAALARTGRWSVESASRSGHDTVRTGPYSAPGLSLVHRAWLGGPRRLETVREYAARVQADLKGSVEDIRSRGLGAPRLFACPYSECEPPDGPLRGALVATASRVFGATMIDDDRWRPAAPTERAAHRLWRLDALGILPLARFVAVIQQTRSRS